MGPTFGSNMVRPMMNEVATGLTISGTRKNTLKKVRPTVALLSARATIKPSTNSSGTTPAVKTTVFRAGVRKPLSPSSRVHWLRPAKLALSALYRSQLVKVMARENTSGKSVRPNTTRIAGKSRIHL